MMTPSDVVGRVAGILALAQDGEIRPALAQLAADLKKEGVQCPVPTPTPPEPGNTITYEITRPPHFVDILSLPKGARLTIVVETPPEPEPDPEPAPPALKSRALS